MQGFRFFAMHIRGKEEMICSIINEPTVRTSYIRDFLLLPLSTMMYLPSIARPLSCPNAKSGLAIVD